MLPETRLDLLLPTQVRVLNAKGTLAQPKKPEMILISDFLNATITGLIVYYVYSVNTQTFSDDV